MLPNGVRFDAVLFDCDGVLVDSEHITNQVLRDMLDERGWRMDLQECMDVFVGKTVMDERARIERHTGQPLTSEWLEAFRARRNALLETHIEAIPNVGDALHKVHILHQGRIACASGADRFKVELMLRKVGLHQYLEGRIFSGQETPRNKPHPDVYLAAAHGLGVSAQRCAVVEDTLTGLAAGVAAGATVFAYVPSGNGQRFIEAGAHRVFSDMAHLPALLG